VNEEANDIDARHQWVFRCTLNTEAGTLHSGEIKMNLDSCQWAFVRQRNWLLWEAASEIERARMALKTNFESDEYLSFVNGFNAGFQHAKMVKCLKDELLQLFAERMKEVREGDWKEVEITIQPDKILIHCDGGDVGDHTDYPMPTE
jgi:hypothetical protein